MTELFTCRSVLSTPARQVFAWLGSTDAIREMIPEWEQAVVEKPAEAMRVGATAIIVMKVGPFRRRWVAEYTECEDLGDQGGYFVDVQKQGPFASWKHRHEVTARGPSVCLFEDRIEYELPGWIFGRLFGSGIARRKIERMFAWRHSVMVRKFGRPSAPKT